MQSKLAILMWTFKLQRELVKDNNAYVTVNALHPGVVNTDLYKHTNIVCRLLKYLGGKMLKVRFTSSLTPNEKFKLDLLTFTTTN